MVVALMASDGSDGTGRMATERPLGVLVTLGLCALMVAGCVVGPNYLPPSLSFPSRWSAADGMTPSRPPALSHWWERFGDPVLDGLIEEAVAGNLDVAAARARIHEARASLREAGGSLEPTVTGSASAKRGGNGGDGYSQFQAGFDASWELDLFGANRRSVEAARYGLDAAAEDLRSTLLTLVGDIAATYVDARGLQARIALSRRTVISERETARLTRVKFEAGSVSALDLAKADGLASSTAADVASLEADLAIDVHRLAVLTGRAPGDLDDRMAAVRPIPRPRLPMPAGIPADVLTNRPDVRLAERQLAQATASIGVAEAARYPSVSLTGNIATSADRIGDLGRASSISWALGPTLTVPLFNGGKLAAAEDAAWASRDASYASFRSTVLGALEDVENALVALSKERKRKVSLDAAAVSYRQALTLARSLYQSGGASFLDVLDAERSAYSAETSALTSAIAVATDYVALHKALGGGWSGEIDAVRSADNGDHQSSGAGRGPPAGGQREPPRSGPVPGGGPAASGPPERSPSHPPRSLWPSTTPSR